MNPYELTKCLDAIVAMEREVFTQKQLLGSLNYKINTMGVPKTFKKPERPPEEELDDESMDSLMKSIGILGGVGLFLGLIAFGLLFGSGKMLLGAVIGGAIGIGFGYYQLGNAIEVVERRNKKRETDYEYAEIKYGVAVDQDKKRVEEEKKALVLYLQEYELVQNEVEKAEALLQRLYERCEVFPKYHNFVMISSIYEYFITERASTLGEAYNLLETEMRLDRISSQLDTIIQHLEDIKNNQYVIYSAISSATDVLRMINDSNNEIEETVRKLQGEGEELNSRVAELQVSSALNVYFEEVNRIENMLDRQFLSNYR